MPVKEKLVKILAPGVGWKEMAAQNRRRNDTSRHAVGVWEEFSFLDKGSIEKGEEQSFSFFWELSWLRPAVCSLSRTAIKSFGEVLEIPEKRKYFLFSSESPKASWKIEERRAHATCSYQQPHQVPKVRSL
jgi:hypothetical protein